MRRPNPFQLTTRRPRTKHWSQLNCIRTNGMFAEQGWIIVTTEGRVITGLIEKEMDSSITVRTLTESVTVAESEIEETKFLPIHSCPQVC